jgi:hypothetical protein
MIRPVRNAIILFIGVVLASLLLSALIWRPLLKRNRPTTAPPTDFERRFGNSYDMNGMVLMAKRMPSPMHLDGPLDKVIDSLRDGRNLYVDWPALKRAKIPQNAPVRADVGGLPFQAALETILASADGGTKQLTFMLDEGAVTISTMDNISVPTATRVYDVRDLTATPPLPAVPAGRGQVLFPGPGPATTPQMLALVTQVQSTVDATSWRDAGGNVGSIRILSGNLIVNQTPANHQDILRLLEQLRWRHDLRAFGVRASATAGASITIAFAARALLQQRRRRARLRQGLCRGCGYDLRASSGRCPECGRSFAAPSPAASPA